MENSVKGIPVLFENDHCLVLNKPPGLSVQGGEGVKTSLDSILSETISPRPFLVHRLDRDTSGLILTAKTKEDAAWFSSLFAKNRTLTKRYLGVCSGIIKPDQGLITLSLEVKGKGAVQKKSETHYRLVSSAQCRLPNEADGELSFSLLELELGTGRMHQIRRHLSLLGHPLLGDDKYGDFALNRKLKKAFGLKHLLLHASRLIIPPSPKFPDGLDVSAPLPAYFSRFVEERCLRPCALI